MGRAIAITRPDISARELRFIAKRTRGCRVVRRILAIVNFVAVPGHWGTLPLSMKGALNGTTSKNIYRRFQGRRR